MVLSGLLGKSLVIIFMHQGSQKLIKCELPSLFVDFTTFRCAIIEGGYFKRNKFIVWAS